MKVDRKWRESIIFYRENNEPFHLAVEVPQFSKERSRFYNEWLAVLTECINESLHPALPGGWINIDCGPVSSDMFKTFLTKLQEQNEQVACPHSVKKVPHRKLPYRVQTTRVSYRLYSLSSIENVLLENRILALQESQRFTGFDPSPETEEDRLSIRERIILARQKGAAGYLERVKDKPTSRSSINCGWGEGRKTREIELIWWPMLYPLTQYGKMQLRFHLNKCNL